jgi:tight adherence protein B
MKDLLLKINEVKARSLAGITDIWVPVESILTKNASDKNKYISAVKTIYNLSKKYGVSAYNMLDGLSKIIKLEIKLKSTQKTSTAEAKTTAKLLMCLPVFCIGLGFLIGTNPLKVLFSFLGLIILLFGGLFLFLGAKITNLMAKNSRVFIDIDKMLCVSLIENACTSGLSISASLKAVGTMKFNIYSKELSELGNAIDKGNLDYNTKNRYTSKTEISIIKKLAQKIFLAKNTRIYDNTFIPKVIKIIKITVENGIAPAILFRDLFSEEIDILDEKSQINIAKLGVYVMLPLGMCFLPAFIILGLIPVFISFLEKVQL